jgi:hypothetical protein
MVTVNRRAHVEKIIDNEGDECLFADYHSPTSAASCV